MDYLDRGTILDYLNEICQKTTGDAYVAADYIRDKMRVIPAADVQLIKHGHWIEINTIVGSRFRCSICEHDDSKSTAIRGHYCWHCGAKMDAERLGGIETETEGEE